ncbi:hypothetical protein [Buchnera aphidicola]|uniref:hypothetical protein n=1 Tax=Buchnera aphidicola TaxID=9 RepID=UPI0012AC21C9|nr:hypothetical protein [Buchnera aphidicola]
MESYKNKKIEIKRYLLQLKKYQDQYNFFLYKKFIYGTLQYIIKRYIEFLSMLQKLIIQQNTLINYLKKKIKEKFLVYKKLYSNLEQWKKLEMRLKIYKKKRKRIAEQSEDNIICLNIYNYFLYNKKK